jgi:hypothetical protein
MTNLKTIFKQDITRPIEGVIKADDEEHLLREVREYVFTDEVRKKLTQQFIDHYNDYAGINGVWISGFFGSGKSHLLKMLSLLLEDRKLEGERVAELLCEKVDDALLKAELQKAAKMPSRSILFNIDQKADIISKDQEDAVLSVFVKVFNEMQGYYPKLGYVAELERDLDNEGLYENFKTAFQKADSKGRSWEQRRNRLKMATGAFAKALAEVKGISEEDAVRFIDRYRDDYTVSIESFAKMVKEYIDRQEPGFRLNFFVDEVGQYIADNTKLMTNLQTIAESLATVCKGQAWVFVTSQEDIDAVVGAVSARRSNDFTKIQARFTCRINLTSGNVDEVIQRRLLDKNEKGEQLLRPVYEAEQNNFQTLFHFGEGGTSFRGYEDEAHFTRTYPFLSYQFTLFQQCIRGLSLQNAFQGKHQSVGERSMLGVFQDVVKSMIADEMGVPKIASFDRMYDGIQGSLLGEIQSAVQIAEQNLKADPFLVRVLKALFLVKFVKTFKPTLKHIAILLIDDFHVDLHQHEKQVQEALNRLEYETYIQRNGEDYEYLTNVEKDIENEIKGTSIDSTEINEILAQVVYKDVFRDTKIRYQGNQQDYSFARKLDGALVGRNAELSLNIISPQHEHFSVPDILKSHTMATKELMVRLPEDDRLLKDIRMYKQVDKYFRQNSSNQLKEEVHQILQRKKTSNDQLYKSLINRAERMLGRATLILNGEELSAPASSNARNRITEALQELISYAFPNLRMLKQAFTESDLKTILDSKADDLFRHGEESLSEAERELLDFTLLSSRQGERLTVSSLLEKFGKAPYGWPEMGTLCLTARLMVRNKLELKENSELLGPEDAFGNLTNLRLRPQTLVEPLPEIDARSLKLLQDLHRDLFNEANPGSDPKEAAIAFQRRLREETQELKALLRQTDRYPFLQELQGYMERLEQLASINYNKYYEQLDTLEKELVDFKEDTLDPVKSFMAGQQRKIFDDITQFLERGQANNQYIDPQALDTLQQLAKEDRPYMGNKMQWAKEQLDKCRGLLRDTLDAEKNKARKTVQELREKLQGIDVFEQLTEAQQDEVLKPFDLAMGEIDKERYIGNLRDFVRQFEEQQYPRYLSDMYDRAKPTPPEGVVKPQTANARTGSTAETATKPTERRNFIQAFNIKVPFGKSYLRNAEDVDAYLEQLRAAYLEQLDKDRDILL